MKELPIIVSIISHIFFNPLLFFMVLMALEKSKNEDEDLQKLKESNGDEAVFNVMAWTYVVGSVVCYVMGMTVLFGVLYLFRLTHGLDNFIITQFGYSSYWRAPIVIVMAINLYFWAARPKDWGATGLLLGPPLMACAIIQIVLFFRHMY